MLPTRALMIVALVMILEYEVRTFDLLSPNIRCTPKGTVCYNMEHSILSHSKHVIQSINYNKVRTGHEKHLCKCQLCLVFGTMTCAQFRHTINIKRGGGG